MTLMVFLATLTVFALAMLGMSVGVLVGRARLRGSCGGVGGRCDSGGEPVCRGLCRSADTLGSER
jgi:hypothetical protein